MSEEWGKRTGTTKKSLGGRAAEEQDPQWKQWFLEVERRRDSLRSPKTVVRSYEKEDGRHIVVQKKSTPLPLKKILASLERLPRGKKAIGEDVSRLQLLWPELVTPDIAAESQIYSFRNGVLTVAVGNSSLLQELRQFHKVSLLQDLRDRWPLVVPLLDIKFRAEKK